MLFSLGSRIIDKFEKFSHWWQKLTGFDCFWLARLCLFLFAGSIIFPLSISAFYELPHNDNWYVLLVFIVFLALVPKFMGSIKRDEERLKNAAGERTANINKLVCPDICCFLLFYAIISFCINSWSYGMFLKSTPAVVITIMSTKWIWISFSLFFRSCDPLTLDKSKVRQWLEKFAEAVKGIFTPIPEPVPVRIPSR